MPPCCDGQSTPERSRLSHQPRCSMARARRACAIHSGTSGFCLPGGRISSLPRWSGAQTPSSRSMRMSEHESQTRPHERARAKTKVTVTRSEARPYDQTASPALVEIRLSETFTGDIEGESTVQALQVRRDDRSASMVSMQRVRGKLGDRHGTFVLQGTEIVEAGQIKATWFVVPGSGTEGLSGLRGEGGFEGDFGKGSNGTLDYWFVQEALP